MNTRQPVILAPGAGRAWPKGRIGAVFKADGDETRNTCSISVPGGFEPHMAGIAAWFQQHPPGEAGKTA